MKKQFKIFGCTLVVFIALFACKKNEDSLFPDLISEKENVLAVPVNDSLDFGVGRLSPLTGTLTNIVSENFESGGQAYYCYQLKLEKWYPIHIGYPNGGSSSGNNSYAINFKFFSTQESGPVDEELKIEFLNDLIFYYTALDRTYAADKKALGFLFGDRTLDPQMSGYEYLNYLKSQVRIKSGSLHIKKSGELYLVSFDGETETGEIVSCVFNDKISVVDDNQIESFWKDFSLSEPQGSYIKKDKRYYKLVDGYYYVFKRANDQSYSFQTVQVISWRDYYWFEYNYNKIEPYSGNIDQHWKSTALFLQFQFEDPTQFDTKTYHVASSEGIYSLGYGLGALRNIPFKGFPNDSLVIGYYHIATDTPFTFTYDEDQDYMNSQIALKSGQLQVTKNNTEYEFDGSFTDAEGKEVQVKLKVTPYPWQFEW